MSYVTVKENCLVYGATGGGADPVYNDLYYDTKAATNLNACALPLDSSGTEITDANWCKTIYVPSINTFYAIRNDVLPASTTTAVDIITTTANTVMQSTDGVNWTVLSSSPQIQINDMVWVEGTGATGGSLFVVTNTVLAQTATASFSCSLVQYTPDTDTWTPLLLQFYSSNNLVTMPTNLTGITYISDSTIQVISNNGNIYYKDVSEINTDTVWNLDVTISQANPTLDSKLFSFYNASIEFAIISSLTESQESQESQVYYKKQGDTEWTLETDSDITSQVWNDLQYSPALGLYAMVGTDGAVATTSDLSSWEVINVTTSNWTSITWSDLGLFFAVSEDSQVMYSFDGAIWNDYSVTTATNFQSCVWASKLAMFNVVGKDNIYITVLNIRKPTDLTVFNSEFNRIDGSGNWTFGEIVRVRKNLIVNKNFSVNGDTTVNGHLLINGNITVEGSVNIPGTIPIGGILLWSGVEVPSNWGLCDGTLYKMNQYTVQSPNLTGRFVLGSDGTIAVGDTGAVGATGGSDFILVDNLPAHSHTIQEQDAEGNPSGSHKHKASIKAGDDGGTKERNFYSPFETPDPSTVLGDGKHTHIIEQTGGGQPYYPPYYALAYIIRIA